MGDEGARQRLTNDQLSGSLALSISCRACASRIWARRPSSMSAIRTSIRHAASASATQVPREAYAAARSSANATTSRAFGCVRWRVMSLRASWQTFFCCPPPSGRLGERRPRPALRRLGLRRPRQPASHSAAQSYAEQEPRQARPRRRRGSSLPRLVELPSRFGGPTTASRTPRRSWVPLVRSPWSAQQGSKRPAVARIVGTRAVHPSFARFRPRQSAQRQGSRST
jgi:hypothetical protein